MAVARHDRIKPSRLNEVWGMDFVADQLANGAKFHTLTIIDVFSKDALAIEVGQRLRGEHVIAALSRLAAQRQFLDECLNLHSFETLEDAKMRIETCRWDCNERRPHMAPSSQSPVEFAHAAGLLRPAAWLVNDQCIISTIFEFCLKFPAFRNRREI